QLGLGLLTPYLLMNHILGTRMVHEVFGVNDNYYSVLLTLWVFKPSAAITQVSALLVTWGHGCIGLHLWLRFKDSYRGHIAYWYGGALLVPVLGLSGFVVAGLDVVRLAGNPRWMQKTIAGIHYPSQADIDWVLATMDKVGYGYIAAVVFLFAARQVRLTLRNARRGLTIQYGDGQEVMVAPGASILDASRQSGIPHASVCGGRGRCSTCRVRIGVGFEDLPAPSDAELKVLERIGAAPNVRLACQTRPTARVEVTPLLPPHQVSVQDAGARAAYSQGQERDIVVMFADIRGFTQISEQRLPYDVVFILNRYFAEMGAAIEGAGGRIDKFIGDGVMALFAVDNSYPEGCRDALRAAKAMAENLKSLNDSLSNDLDAPLRIGIGIHGGAAIVGELGYRQTRGLTAVGDIVNTASRLETLTKEYTAQLVVSGEVVDAAGADLSAFKVEEVRVRGREESMMVHIVDDASGLPT
ncbi:MAG: adenylate/guanylate cyclase domain-containing protein, partial [Proteobacteria bacterium]|nr:adenylate/guanylate cyclase domain-containing protein [Pseudomonadota bacterium]